MAVVQPFKTTIVSWLAKFQNKVMNLGEHWMSINNLKMFEFWNTDLKEPLYKRSYCFGQLVNVIVATFCIL